MYLTIENDGINKIKLNYFHLNKVVNLGEHLTILMSQKIKNGICYRLIYTPRDHIYSISKYSQKANLHHGVNI